jgi:Protein of unknown function (DUF4238)
MFCERHVETVGNETVTPTEPKQHFLPQCYQKGFADSSRKVWVKFADKPTPEHRNPDSVGWQRGLYAAKSGQEIENYFGKEVENAFGALSRRIKRERNKFSEITGDELAALARFIASQTVRTLAHEQCIREQAGGPVDKRTFNRVMLRKMRTIINTWVENFPAFHFYTPLPYVGEQFITGDHPVLVIQMKQNPIWVPTDTPILQITALEQILQNPSHAFWISLSPYVCASIQGHSGGKPHLPPKTMEPPTVRQFNEFVRGQCKIFTVARDRESLA